MLDEEVKAMEPYLFIAYTLTCNVTYSRDISMCHSSVAILRTLLIGLKYTSGTDNTVNIQSHDKNVTEKMGRIKF